MTDEPRPAPNEEPVSDEAQVEEDLDALVDDTARERDEYLELAKRTQADFENYRKRMAAEVQAASVRGKAELAAGLIGVIDNLERALEAVGIEPGGEQAPAEPLAEGFFLTYRELCAALARAGIEPFDPAGERFDPNRHEALQKLPAEGAEPGTVVETMQKGYMLGEQLIRPARVVVSE
jgi:molecular chaperone GrpE